MAASASSSSSSDQAVTDHLDGAAGAGAWHIKVIVEPSPLTYMSGYANRFRELFRYLKEVGDSVEIITTECVVKDDKLLPKSHLGFPIIYTAGFRLPNYPIMSISCDYWLLSWKIPRRLIRRRPDLIHVTSPGMFIMWTALWARLLQVPLLISYHTHLPVYVHSYVPRWICRGLLLERLIWCLIRCFHSLADVTVVTSTALQEDFRRHGIAGVQLWPKGIDTTTFHPQRATKEWRNRCLNKNSITTALAAEAETQDDNDDKCILLYVGRLAVEKRLHDLHKVMHELPKQYHLAIVGKGPYEGQLKSLFADCRDRVTFMGPLYGPDLQAVYASADIFVLPSDSETLGFVVMESMASGVPVVAARAGGIPDMVQDGINGYLVSVGDVDEYVRAIQKMGVHHATDREAMGKRARAIAETWTWDESMSVLRNQLYPMALQNFRTRLEQRIWRFLTWQK